LPAANFSHFENSSISLSINPSKGSARNTLATIDYQVSAGLAAGTERCMLFAKQGLHRT
jgi:hypothetical protein